jgi:hypothetical protein
MTRRLRPAAAGLLTVAAAAGAVAPAASAATYTADPSIADTTSPDPCSTPCALRQAVADANGSTDATNTIVLRTGTYTLTQGPLQLVPAQGTAEELIGQGSHATDTVIEPQGSGLVLSVGNGNVGSPTLGNAVIALVEVTGGNHSVGGGIYVQPNGNLTLDQSLVAGNTATSSGGGIDTNGQLAVEDSTIANNQVTGGLGIGGGIDNFSEQGGVTIIDSTLTGNSVPSASTSSLGGAINNGAPLSILNSTIAGNSAPASQGGGIANSSTAKLVNTILSNNAGGDCQTSQAISSLGHNIADDASCSGLSASTGDLTSTDPLLQQSGGAVQLADNGGATSTIALTSSSPAIDAGLASACPSTDQRGAVRPDAEDPAGSACDIGAFEFTQQSSSPTVAGVSPSSGPGAGGTSVTIAGRGLAGATAVRFGSASATTFTVVSDTQITATAPAGTGTVDVTVTTPGGTSTTSPADRFTYIPPPTVTAVSPSSGPAAGGTSVTIAGSGFAGATGVHFGSTAATSFTVGSDAQITATAPAGTGTVDVTVITPNGTSATSAADQFTYNPTATGSPPAVTPVTPTIHSSTTATFSGTVNPQGQATTAHFEYYLDPKYGTTTVLNTPDQQVGSDAVDHPVSASVSGLVPNALYHVVLVASNSAGTTVGPDQTFTTPKDPTPPPPKLGQSVDAGPVSGTVLVKLPGGGFVPLTEARDLPPGAQVDARHGTMQITAALPQAHQTETGQFGGALFGFSQPRHGPNQGLATLTLLEGLFPGAPSYASCQGRLSSQVLQSLTASDHAGVAAHASRQGGSRSRRGGFSSRGGYASATVRGTFWVTIDRCDGTLIIVKQGSVAVNDFVRHTTVILHAGQRYLARARKLP